MEVSRSLLSELSEASAVTGSEPRVYRRIIERLRASKKLVLSRNSVGQLVASYRGAPQSARRIVIVAHTDREGFRYRSVIEPGVLEMTHTSDRGSDLARWVPSCTIPGTAAPIRLRIVAAMPTGELLSCGGYVSNITDPARGCVQVNLDDTAVAETVLNALGHEGTTVTAEASYSDLQGGYIDIRANNHIRAAALDNVFGVTTATACLEHAAKEKLLANITVLYTSGEERGFVGLLATIANLDEIVRPEHRDETIWIVLDCSSREHSGLIGLDAWRASMIQNGQFTEAVYNIDLLSGIDQGSTRCDIKRPVIRLEDKGSLFDSRVSRLLLQASLADQPVECGVFRGGFCEASVLCLLPLLLDDCDRPALVGSIALPIENYRGLGVQKADGAEPMEVKSPRPEGGSLKSGAAAISMICEAARLHADHYVMPQAEPIGYRGLLAFENTEMYERMPNSKEDYAHRLKMRLDDQEVQHELASLCRWWDNVGDALLRQGV